MINTKHFRHGNAVFGIDSRQRIEGDRIDKKIDPEAEENLSRSESQFGNHAGHILSRCQISQLGYECKNFLKYQYVLEELLGWSTVKFLQQWQLVQLFFFFGHWLIVDQEPICEHEIRNIHCACQDADDLTHFAYITKDHASRTHFCHVFCVPTMVSQYFSCAFSFFIICPTSFLLPRKISIHFAIIF